MVGLDLFFSVLQPCGHHNSVFQQLKTTGTLDVGEMIARAREAGKRIATVVEQKVSTSILPRIRL